MLRIIINIFCWRLSLRRDALAYGRSATCWAVSPTSFSTRPTSSGLMGYEFTWEARSSSIDETNHIYFPELFRLVDEGVESLLAEIDFSLSRLILEENQALPIVNAEADFLSPIRFGDSVICTIDPDIGESSVRFEASGTVDGRPVFESTIIRVFVDLDSFEKRPLPDDLRAQLAAYASD